MRSWPRVSVGVGLVVLLVALAGCGDTSGPEPIDRVDITTLTGEVVTEARRGELLRLSATAFRGETEVPDVDFEWSSTNLDVATVDSLGRVDALAFGSTTIRATPIDEMGQAGEVDLLVVGAPVAQMEIQPNPAYVDLGDVVEFTVDAVDENGQVVTGAEVEWSVSGSNVEVVDGGEVRGLSAGSFEITATAWNDVEASADGRVTPVTGIGPQSGLWGQDLTISGESLPTDARVYFTGSDTLIRAFIQESSASEYKVWVPVFATSGPITFATPADSFNTSRSFALTAQDDIFRDATEEPAEISLPFHNPSLVIGTEAKILFFEVPEPTPFSVFLTDRSDPAGSSIATVLFLWYDEEGQLQEATTWLFPVDFVDGVWVEDAVYSRELGAGFGGLFIFKADPVDDPGDPSRALEIRLTTETNFELPPDEHEPNDVPQEAPLVDLPFEATGLHAENGHRFDYFVVDIEEPSTLTVNAEGADGRLSLYLFEGDEEGFFLAEEAVDTSFPEAGEDPMLETTVSPGRYSVLVREAGGQATTYDLAMSAEPAAGDVAAAPVPDPAVGRTRVDPSAGRFADLARELRRLGERLRVLPRR